MKKNLSHLSVALLSCFILIGSILQIHSNVANIETQVSFSAEEFESSIDSIASNFFAFVASLLILQLVISIALTNQISSFQSTVPQLLCAHRIALPPPRSLI